MYASLSRSLLQTLSLTFLQTTSHFLEVQILPRRLKRLSRNQKLISLGSKTKRNHFSNLPHRGFKAEAQTNFSIVVKDVVPSTTPKATPAATTPPKAQRKPITPKKVNRKSNIPQAARLPFFAKQWRKVTSNNWVLTAVIEGYKLQFDPDPPPPRPSIHFSHSHKSSCIIRPLIQDYLNKGAIKVVDVQPDQYVSRIFEVPKKTGDYRLILDLSDLNLFLKKVHFKMEGLLAIASLISSGDFLASLDLQDAFLTIAMHSSCFKYLCFDFDGVRYCFIALVFGLSCAPRIFTKLLKVPLSHLRLNGIKNSAWLDDILLVGSSYSETLDIINQSRSLLESLGFIVKQSKSHLTPTQSITHVGFIWDSVKCTVSVPTEKVSALKENCSFALTHPISLRFLARIIGIIDSFRFGCPIVPLHYRSLQSDLIRNSGPPTNWDSKIILSPLACADLEWWLECDLSLRPAPLASFSPTHQMETDASKVGWGAFAHSNSFTQGKWSPKEAKFHINFLELWTVLLGIKALFRVSSPISLLILCDNTSAVNYINRMGGTKSKFLCNLALELWDYCLSHNIWLKAVYLRGSENVRADTLSRVFSDNHDYFLSDSWFSLLHSHLDFCLDLDLFADRLHHHLPRYSSRFPDPNAELIDAFSFHWTGNLYLFPPVVLLSRVINKFISDNCQFGLLIAPYHPSSPVFSSILNLCISPPIILPDSAVAREPHHCKVSPLRAWIISCNPSLQKEYLQTLSPICSRTSRKIQSRNTNHTGSDLHIGVTKGKLVLATYL